MGDKKGFMAKTTFELPSGWEYHIGRKGVRLSLQVGYMKQKLIQETVTSLMRLKHELSIFVALSKNAHKALSTDNQSPCTNYKDPCGLFTAPIS